MGYNIIKEEYKSISIIAFSLLVALLYISIFNLTQFDDAFMFIRYANNTLEGYGHVWNKGQETVYGSTSLLYYFYITIFVFIGNTLELSASTTLTIATTLLALGCIYFLALIHSHFDKTVSFFKIASKYFALLICLTPFLVHLMSGMDTLLSMLMHSVLIYCVITYNKERNISFLKVVLAAYFLVMARPDNLIIAVLFPSLYLLIGLQSLKKAFVFCLSLTLLLCLESLIKYFVLNDFLPLAFYAKRSGFYEGYTGHHFWEPWSHNFLFIASCVPFLLLNRFIFSKNIFKYFIIFILPTIITLAYYMTIVQIMGQWARYQYPFLVYIITFLVIAKYTNPLSKYDSTTLKHTLKTITLAAILYAGLFLLLKFTYPISVEHLKSNQTSYQPKTIYAQNAETKLPDIKRSRLVESLANFANSLPSGTKFALSEYGYISAIAKNIFIVDTIGLHDPFIAHNGFNVNYLIEQKPDIIWLPHIHYTKIRAELLDNHTFQTDYTYLGTAFIDGFAIRKNGPLHDDIFKHFEVLWREIYPSYNMNDYISEIKKGKH